MNEFNDIPRRRRQRMFTVAAWFNGGLAGTLFVLYLTCMRSWRLDSESKWNERLNDYKARTEKELEVKIKQAALKFDPAITETQRKIDSLQNRLDSLNQKGI
jgi:hypothetical protein